MAVALCLVVVMNLGNKQRDLALARRPACSTALALFRHDRAVGSRSASGNVSSAHRVQPGPGASERIQGGMTVSPPPLMAAV